MDFEETPSRGDQARSDRLGAAAISSSAQIGARSTDSRQSLGGLRAGFRGNDRTTFPLDVWAASMRTLGSPTNARLGWGLTRPHKASSSGAVTQPPTEHQDDIDEGSSATEEDEGVSGEMGSSGAAASGSGMQLESLDVGGSFASIGRRRQGASAPEGSAAVDQVGPALVTFIRRACSVLVVVLHSWQRLHQSVWGASPLRGRALMRPDACTGKDASPASPRYEG